MASNEPLSRRADLESVLVDRLDFHVRTRAQVCNRAPCGRTRGPPCARLRDNKQELKEAFGGYLSSYPRARVSDLSAEAGLGLRKCALTGN